MPYSMPTSCGKRQRKMHSVIGNQKESAMRITRLEIREVNEQGTFIRLKAYDEQTTIIALLQTTNVRLAQLMGQWYVHLRSSEQENLIKMMQQLKGAGDE
jgi:phosphomannomutase